MNFNTFRATRKLDDKGKHVRCVIPTKDNPPPELNSWLLQFQVPDLCISIKIITININSY